MRYLFDGRIPIEWIFTVGQESTLAAYPGKLEDDLAAMAGRLRNYADGKLNAAALAKTAQQFVERSLKAFELDWDSLREEFYDTKPSTSQYHPDLEEIKALFAAEDTPENRTLILIRVWKKVREMASHKIRDADSALFADTQTTNLPQLNPPQKQPTVSIQHHNSLRLEY
jgi:hypothetical protein